MCLIGGGPLGHPKIFINLVSKHELGLRSILLFFLVQRWNADADDFLWFRISQDLVLAGMFEETRSSSRIVMRRVSKFRCWKRRKTNYLLFLYSPELLSPSPE